jgi:D-alanyl-D-alanine carboxypeptidase
MKYLKTYCLLSLIGLGLFFNSCSNDAVTIQENSLESKIDKICDSIISVSGLPGMIVGIWDPDKNFTYVKGIGYANIQDSTKMKPEMIFRVASNSKSFVVQEILLLAQEGKLSINDTLSKYFPNYPNGDKITLEMLCNMSSGIIDYTEANEITSAFLTNSLKVWQPHEVIDITANYNLLFPPGTNYHYSSVNTFFLGLIIEKLRNKSIDEVFKEHYFIPLELNNTSFCYGNKLPTNGVHGYVNITYVGKFIDDFSEKLDMSLAWCAGSIACDIYDLKKWLTNLTYGNLLNTEFQQLRFKAPEFENSAYKYAMGIETYGNNIWGHCGTLPGYTSTMMQSKTNGYTVIIFYNFYNDAEKPLTLFFRITKELYPEMVFSQGF